MPQQKIYLNGQGEQVKTYLNESGEPLSPSEISSKLTPQSIKDISKKVAPYTIPALGTLAGAAAAAIVPETLSYLPGLLSSGTMAGIEEIFKPKEDRSLKNIAINTALNEIGGRAISGGIKGLGIVSGGITGALFPKLTQKFNIPSIDQSLLKLKPTTAQITGSKLLEFVENNFGSNSKEAALIRSGKLSQEEANNLIRRITGRSDININTPFKQAENIEKNTLEQFEASQKESTLRGNNIKLIAESKPINVTSYSSVPSTIMPEQNIIVKANSEIVKGPIIPNNLVNTAKIILAKIENSDHKPDPNNPLVRDLQNILLNNQVMDSTGTIVPKARNFKDAWQSKQDFGNLGFPNPRSQQVITDIRYKDLYHAINKDIEESILKWGAGTDVALAARQFNEAKLIVNKRHELFDEKPIEKLVNEETGNIPAIDKIIHDPKLLNKSLLTGSLVIPEGGNDIYTGIKYITNNTRQDLAGYELTQLLNKAQVTDNKGNISFNGNKLLDLFNDIGNQESYKKLWNAQNRANIEQFFKNIAQTESKGQIGMRPYWALRLTGTGIALGAGLATSLVSGSVPSGIAAGSAIIGATLTASQLNKLLTNPDSARLMVSLAQNNPLNMSVGLASRVVANVLKNQVIKINYQDGNEQEFKIDKNGKLRIPLGENK